jgi:ABC-type branched-subunit amino acid transport system ATPase component/branched-subunit amino acid ABC-type transport system permease component
MLAFIIAGLVSGAVYGLIGIGLVLTYRTSGIFNFALGALGTVGAYVFYWLHIEHSVPLGVTIVLCLFVLAPLLGLGLERIAVRLTGVGLAMQIAATVGVLLVIESLGYLLFGPADLTFPKFLPSGSFKVGGTFVGWDQLIIFAVSLASAAALSLFLRRARMGKSMLAVVDNAELLSLSGTSPVVVRRWAWIISSFLVTLSGLVLAPSVGLTPTTLTLLVIQGFGAAAIGAFTSIPLTWLGGLIIGVVASLITEHVNSTGVLGGLAASLPFIVLFLVILFLPRRRLISVGGTAKLRSLSPTWTFPPRFQLLGGAVTLVVLVLIPGIVGFRLDGWSTSLTYVMLLLSLGLLVRTSGQVSLCQVTFAAFGVVAFSKLTGDLGIPWAPALVLSGLIVVPIGALLAIPAIRLTGLYLALATFGFGLLVQNMFYQTNVMFGASNAGLPVPAPNLGSWISSDKAVYYVILFVTFLTVLLVVALTRTRLGRLLRAMSDSPLGLSGQGTSVTTARVLVFCISAFIAAIAGALLGVVQTTVTGLSYDPNTSLLLLVLIVITVGGEPWYALLAAVGLGIIPTYISGGNVTYYLTLIFGFFAVVVALQPPARLPAAWRAAIDRVGGRKRHTLAIAPAGSIGPSRPAQAHEPEPIALELSDLVVRFGGLRAVDEVSFSAGMGKITGLVGPNGAGKSTIFNACSGLVRPSAGTISMGGRDISRLSPWQRAQLGIGRTFQQLELFDSMTVEQNVAIGREAGFADGNVVAQVFSRRSERTEISNRTAAAIELCGLVDHADVTARDLSTGQRRLVELARCLAGSFNIILLDEPSAGLDETETAELGTILERVVAERGIGVLLVEHDMSLVMRVCSYIHVLDFGKLIFKGTPPEVRASRIVQDAYLGSDELEAEVV